MENQSMRNHELPEVIIQHIQSFLETREAAETILVSKSWLRAWSARPFLSLGLWLESERRYMYVSSDVIDRTLESYVDRGITIVRFNLQVETIQERWLKKLRQSNVIELYLHADNNWTDSLFQEIFLTKSLQVLRVVSNGSQCQLVLSHSDIKCLNLRKILFQNMEIDEVTFYRIMSSCPLIEELVLDRCKLLDFPSYNPGIQSFMFAGVCASLKRLSLFVTEINDEQLQTILSKSPQLEDFSLIHYRELVTQINLSSVSLKSVNLDMWDVQVVLDNTPNLRELKITGREFLTITSPITKGMVKITIDYTDRVMDESWFYAFNEVLSKIAKSNVKFTLYYDYPFWTHFRFLRATSIPTRPEVETLTFRLHINLPLLYAFFHICHPKIVLLCYMGLNCVRKLLIQLLNDLSYRGNLECCSFNRNKCWRHFIKEAKLYYGINNEKEPLDMIVLETECWYDKLITLDLEWEKSD